MRFSMRFSGSRYLIVAMLMLAALIVAIPARATTYTWTGAVSSDWNTAGNWNPLGVPNGQYDTITFGPATRTTVTISSSRTNSAGALTFAANAPAYTISITGAPGDIYSGLELYGGLVNQSATTRPSFVTTSQGQLTLGDGVFNAISVTNSGGVGLLQAGNNPSITNSTIVNNSGGDVFFITGSAPSADTTTIVNNAGSVVDVSEDFSSAVATIGSLSGAGNVFLGSKAMTLGGLNKIDTISGVIADVGDASGTGGTLTKTGSGTLILSGANTYTGKTTVQSGTLQIDGSLASDEILLDSGAILSGAGSIGDLVAQAASLIIPGNANPNTTLHAGRLLCANAPVVQERIGDVGGSTHGTYLSLSQSLQSGFCPHLHFRFTSAGVPLAVGQAYLLVLIQGSTDFNTSNVDFDFNYFPGYRQATGTFSIGNIGSVSTIYFQPTDLGNEIFRNGFELIN